jgi:hypothetical protein
MQRLLDRLLQTWVLHSQIIIAQVMESHSFHPDSKCHKEKTRLSLVTFSLEGMVLEAVKTVSGITMSIMNSTLK